MQIDRKNRIAIVTGAGSGIGKTMAVALHHDGWTTVLAGRRDKNPPEKARDLEAERYPFVLTDVCNPVSVKLLFDKTIVTYGHLDLLFNNAEIGSGQTAWYPAQSSGRPSFWQTGSPVL